VTKVKPTYNNKKGPDGLTVRERNYVRERRADICSPESVIMQRAGYEGSAQNLTIRARTLMRCNPVAMAVRAPSLPDDKPLDQEVLKDQVIRTFRQILNSDRTSDADKIKAGKELLSTIPGGYVPLQVVQKGSFTLESWVQQMGGSPAELDQSTFITNGADDATK